MAENKQKINFIETIGAALVGFRDDRFLAHLDIEPRHHNMMGFVHGGVLAALLDTVMARSYILGLPEEKRNGVTLEMKVNFIKAVKWGSLTAIGQVINSSRQTGYVEGVIEDDTGKLVAKASATILQVGTK